MAVESFEPLDEPTSYRTVAKFAYVVLIYLESSSQECRTHSRGHRLCIQGPTDHRGEAGEACTNTLQSTGSDGLPALFHISETTGRPS